MFNLVIITGKKKKCDVVERIFVLNKSQLIDFEQIMDAASLLNTPNESI